MDPTNNEDRSSRAKWNWALVELLIPKAIPLVALYFLVKQIRKENRPRQKHPTPFVSKRALYFLKQTEITESHPRPPPSSDSAASPSSSAECDTHYTRLMPRSMEADWIKSCAALVKKPSEEKDKERITMEQVTEKLANFMAKTATTTSSTEQEGNSSKSDDHCCFRAENFTLTSGGMASAMEMLSQCLCQNAGVDVFLVLCPLTIMNCNWITKNNNNNNDGGKGGGLMQMKTHLWLRSRVSLMAVPCIVVTQDSDTATTTEVKVQELDKAYKRCTKRGLQVRAVVLSNPETELGQALTPEALCEVLQFACDKNIHIICDETGWGSLHDPSSSNFTTVIEMASSSGEETVKSRVHAIYWSLPLFVPRLGTVAALYSCNSAIAAATRKMAAAFSPVTSHSLAYLAAFYDDDDAAAPPPELSPESQLPLAERCVQEWRAMLWHRYQNLKQELLPSAAAAAAAAEEKKLFCVCECNAGGCCLLRFTDDCPVNEREAWHNLFQHTQLLLLHHDDDEECCCISSSYSWLGEGRAWLRLRLSHLSDQEFQDALHSIQAHAHAHPRPVSTSTRMLFILFLLRLRAACFSLLWRGR